MKGKNNISCFLLLINMILLIGCSGVSETTLRIAIKEKAAIFDPLILENTEHDIIYRSIFETLINVENSYISPVLAQNWQSYGDSLFVVNIKEDILFSNNVLLTINDVYNSFQRALNYQNSYLKPYAVFIDSLSTLNNSLYIYYNDFSVIFELLDRVPIYHSEVLNQLYYDEFIQTYPLSTGEYFLYYHDENIIRLRKNIYHRNFENNKQSADIVEIIFEPDEYQQYGKFLNGDIDIIFGLPIFVYEEAINNPNLRIVEIDNNSFIVLMLDGVRAVSPDINLPRNPLIDKRVRQAIDYAINVEGYIESVLKGKANRLILPSFRNIKGYPSEINKDTNNYDLEHSRKLMSEAGYSDGFQIKITAKECIDTIFLSEFIKESLKEINIIVSFEFLDEIDFIEKIESSAVSAIYGNFIFNQHFSMEELLSKFFYFPRSHYRGSHNYMNYNVPVIQGLIDALLAMREFDSVRPIFYTRLSELIREETLILPFFQAQKLIVSNKNVIFYYRENYNFIDIRIKK